MNFPARYYYNQLLRAYEDLLDQGWSPAAPVYVGSDIMLVG